LNEFELIRRYFSRASGRPDVVVGVGDDAAICSVPEHHELVLTTDLLVSGTHFLESATPESIGHKALAVNLSDLAAMAAQPTWFTMTLSIPAVDENWLNKFSSGLYALAETSDIALVGGDTVKGPLSVGIHACGLVPTGCAVLRSGAKPGDSIYVTGSLGDAALGLRYETGAVDYGLQANQFFSDRLDKPTPQNDVGISLSGIATSMIDISDGLISDLGHVLDSSRVGAEIRLESIPLSRFYRERLPDVGWGAALSGGDDYELCFTIAAGQRERLEEASKAWQCGVTCIGEITEQQGLRILDRHGQQVETGISGYDHFPD
jgi:thiamine-monophosphate kinase